MQFIETEQTNIFCPKITYTDNQFKVAASLELSLIPV